MREGGGMRQVFAVGGGRSAPVEYSSRSSSARKRERNGGERDMSKGNGRHNRHPWEEMDDDGFWEDENDVMYVPDANRCVSWSNGGGLTIRARNSPPEGRRSKGGDIRPRDSFGESDGNGFRKRMQPRGRDGYGPGWDREDVYDEYEEDYPPFRRESLRGGYQRQEEYRYRDMDAMNESPPSPRSTGPLSNGYRRNSSHDRDYELRGYAHGSLCSKDYMRQPREMRRLSPSPPRTDRFERERSRERYPRRLSPPPRMRDMERERPDYVERGHSRRLTSPPVRMQRREREEANYNAWEDNSRKEPENGYLQSPENRGGNRLEADKEDDLPPGFGYVSKSSPPPRDSDARTCYRCGKPGHVSAQCSMKAERAERAEKSPKRPRVVDEAAGKTCYTCGKIGHFSFQCPSRLSEKEVPVDSSTARRAGKQCYTCGEHGHVSYACPSNMAGKDAGALRTLRRCYNCYEVGHLVHECPMFSDGDALRNEAQDSENDDVMYKTKLTNAEKSQYLRENRCFTCGKTGHPYYSCPQSEKRLEYVFNDREAKSSFKLLKNPCWKYKDDNGDVHGPVSLSCLASRMKDGIVSGDVEVHHMYTASLPPTSVSKLVNISQSSTSVSIISCMPEAASFLGEEMDADTCKANSIAALQTKLHYDIFETTIRWILISSMNEALQHYKTARKYWGKNRPPSAEDYSDPDRSGPPNSSDSSPDGITQQQSFHAMMLVECEKYVTAPKTDDSANNVLAAIQSCIHSGVLEAARNTILDAIIAICLDNWMQSKMTPAVTDLQLESIPMPQLDGIQLPEVISEERSEDSKGTNESSPGQDKKSASPETKWVSPEADKKWSPNGENSPAPAESKKLSPTTTELPDQERSSHPQSAGAKLPVERLSKQPTEQSQALEVDLGHFLTCPPKKRPPPEIKDQCMEDKKQVMEGKKPMKLRIVTRRQTLESEKQSQEVNKAAEPKKQKIEVLKRKPMETRALAKTGTLDTKKPSAESKSEPQETKKRSLEIRRLATEPPKSTDVQSPGSKKQKTETVCNLQPARPATSITQPAKTDDAPPQLVLKVFRKGKKNETAGADASLASAKDNNKQAKKRVLRLCDLADTTDVVLDDQNVEQRLVEKCVNVGDKFSETSREVPVSSELSPDETTTRATTTMTSSLDVDTSGCPRSAGCARCSISGWEWRDWSRNFKGSSKDDVAADECEKRSVSVPVKTARSTRTTRKTRLLARHDGLSCNNMKSRSKLLRLERSKIHTWGVVTVEPIEAEEFVVEYVGELIRPKVADVRESRYERQGLGNSYFFRVGDSCVIDATVRGGLARFINHSCDPNCYTKIITVEGQKRVFIYARRQIAPGTEITYDYKFPREEQKIPCLCRSSRCRGFLN